MKDSFDIFSTLESFPRPELEDIRQYFGASFPSHVRKSDFVARLGSFIIDKPSEWLGRMLERDVRLLQNLVNAGPEVPVAMEYPDYPSVLETVHLIGSDTSDPDFRTLWIPKQLYDVVAPCIDAAIIDGEVSGRFEMERASLGYLQLHGVLTTDEYYDCMVDYWGYAARQDIHDFVHDLYDSPVLRLCRTDIDGVSYVAAPNIIDPGSVIKGREDHRDVTMMKFTPQQAIAAGTGAPFFVFGLDSEEGKALVEMLASLGYSGRELVREEHDIWMNSQMVAKDDSTELIFSSVNRLQDEIESFDEYDRCMEIVADYANSLPKWLLRGHSSTELNRLKVILQSEDDPLEALVRKNPLLGLFVPPAPSDALCPCGSNLTYRNCHGRYRN